MLISFLWTADVSSGATFISFLPDVSLLITVGTFSWSHYTRLTWMSFFSWREETEVKELSSFIWTAACCAALMV